MNTELNFPRRLLAGLTALALLLMLALPVWAEGEETEKLPVSINSVEDLLQLVADCRLDSWSEDRTVDLNTDLDLTGVDFAGIPTFSPEHFARIEQKDTMKRKQFVKGMEQIAQEGAIQIFRDLGSGMEEVVVGVVGVLQLEVLEYRLKNEYNVDIRMQTLPYEHLRWVLNDPDELDIKHLDLTSDTRAIEDMKGNPLLLFGSPWSINWAEQHNPDLKLSEFGNLTF